MERSYYCVCKEGWQGVNCEYESKSHFERMKIPYQYSITSFFHSSSVPGQCLPFPLFNDLRLCAEISFLSHGYIIKWFHIGSLVPSALSLPFAFVLGDEKNVF